MISKRYGKALLLLAEEKNLIDQFEKDLIDINATINADENLKQIWLSFRIGPSAKKDTIKKLFKGKVADDIIKFLMLIIDKNREAYLGDIVTAYRQVADISRNIVEAEVTTAVQLTDKDFRGLQEKLSVVTGKNVRLRTKVNPSLIGGVIVKIGDQIIDGSVIKRLAILHNRLKDAQFMKIGVRD
mgnify:FL=1